jgi:hypothetical protein
MQGTQEDVERNPCGCVVRVGLGLGYAGTPEVWRVPVCVVCVCV